MSAPPGANRAREVLIVGAGIGGLTAALAFARRGARVTVLEAAPMLREVGAGLQITPNGAVVLSALGILAELEGMSEAAAAVELRRGRSNLRLARLPIRRDGMPGWRLLHRADLLAVLARAAQAAGVDIRLGSAAAEIVAPRDAQTRPAVRMVHGEIYAGDLLIGADGIRSRTRLAMGEDAPAAYTGQAAWRAVVPLSEPTPPVSRIHLFGKRHIVTYPLRNGTLMNLVAVVERDWTEHGWDRPGDPDEMRATFADACRPVADLMGQVTETRLWGLFRHPVPARLAEGSIALIGDAAHPTLPFLAQGANLAIEDAWVLAEATDRDMPLTRALDLYSDRRRPRVVRALAAADENARNYHLSGPRALAAHTAIRVGATLAPGLLAGRYDWLHRHDVTKG